MLRMTLFLCVAMIGALAILGEDRGQLRPGLVGAVADGPVAEDPVKPAVAEPVLAAAAVAPKPVAQTAPARPVPEPYVEPSREVVQYVEEPVFTLSSLGNEAVPGEEGVPVDAALEEALGATEAEPESVPETVAGRDGMVWYVNASSVNVRAEPSTEGEVLGKLGTGEAALMVADVDGEWARIVIEGDGMEGYVALRYLSPEAP